MIQEGDVVAGKYRIERAIGAGGMGYVMAAVHVQLGQRVAVKFLAPNLCEENDSVTRFLREARSAVKIQSEHVARVLDVGELPDGTPYMVMEYLSGRDLADELDQPGQLEIPVAIDYLLQAAEAVAEAHSLGVIHRDLKPANLFLTRRPDGTPLVKVLDFGISKAITKNENGVDPEASLTEANSLLGSPAYMSPEQIRRPKEVDARTDIWSLGAILFELLTGDPPFGAESPVSLLAAVVSDPLPKLREQRPDVPAELEDVIAKCLEKKPEHRHQTVADLATALLPFAPNSIHSVSRISGILRASLTPISNEAVEGDGSGSPERTLQSPRVSDAGTEPTEQLVKVVTPAPSTERTGKSGTRKSGSGSGKSTKTDWESGGAPASRSRRRVIVLFAGGAVLAIALAIWQRQSSSGYLAPEKLAPSGGPSAASAGEPERSVGEVNATDASRDAVTAGAPSAAANASAVASSAPTPAPSATVGKLNPQHRTPPASLPAPPPTASVAKVPPPATPAPVTASDPLDGRR